MFPEHVKSIKTLLDTFPTDQSCLEYLEWTRWEGNVTSPFVEHGKTYKCKNGRYMCKETRKYFTARTGSIYEKTKIPLRDWFVAIWLLTSHKKGISSVLLSGEIGVTLKTAWYMSSKIRRSFGMVDEGIETKVSGILELDEAVYGGLNGNRHKDKKFKDAQGGHTPDKTWVLGIFQRNGKLRAYAIPGRKPEFVQPIIRELVEPGSVLITDAWTGYNGLDEEYYHFVVKDGNKIARNFNPEIHTNNIEGAWGTMKRGYNGIYNWWSKKHLQFYLNEFVYRFNHRLPKQSHRFFLFLKNTFQRITYKDIRATAWTY